MAAARGLVGNARLGGTWELGEVAAPLTEAAAAAYAGVMMAVSYTWNAGTSGLWNTPNSWNNGTTVVANVPGHANSDQATIAATGTYAVDYNVTTGDTIADLTISGPNATLWFGAIAGDTELTVTSTTSLTGGEIDVGDIVNNAGTVTEHGRRRRVFRDQNSDDLRWDTGAV